MFRPLAIALYIFFGIGFVKAQNTICPSDLVAFSYPYPGANQNCGVQIGSPKCPKEGWVLGLNGMCQPIAYALEAPICDGGTVMGYPTNPSNPRCIKPYQEIQNGEPIPGVYVQCMKNNLYEGHFSSPVNLCTASIRQSFGNEDIEKIRECVLSGRFNGVAANPQTYCQMRASEFWNSPENSSRQSVWVPR